MLYSVHWSLLLSVLHTKNNDASENTSSQTLYVRFWFEIIWFKNEAILARGYDSLPTTQYRHVFALLDAERANLTIFTEQKRSYICTALKYLVCRYTVFGASFYMYSSWISLSVRKYGYDTPYQRHYFATFAFFVAQF